MPAERPEGIVKGKVLGGLYSGGVINIYTLAKDRVLVDNGVVNDKGEFELDFALSSQPLLVEVRGGFYLEPYSLDNVNPEPEFVLSSIFMFQSGKSHDLSITPFSHLGTGLILYEQDAEHPVTESLINSSFQKLEELYSIEINAAELDLVPDLVTKAITLGGDERQGLLIAALSEIARQQAVIKNDALKNEYSLSTLSAVIYEDLLADGLLDGKSTFDADGNPKTLAFGNQVIDSDFYRLQLGLAAKKTLSLIKINEVTQSQEHNAFISSLALKESELFGDLGKPNLSKVNPQIRLLTSESESVNGIYDLRFDVDNAFMLTEIKLVINNIHEDFEPEQVLDIDTQVYSLPVNTSLFNDGEYTLILNVTDALNNPTSLQFPITFDNSPPDIQIFSANLTNQASFLLQGKYSDNFSPMRNILVDGEGASLGIDGVWSKEVSLFAGQNQFLVQAEDMLGNQMEFVTDIYYQQDAPVVTLLSDSLTNSKNFLLEGAILEGADNIEKILVNGKSTKINAENIWSTSLVLNSGENIINVTVEDKAGSAIEFLTSVTLDDNLPGVSVTSPLITNSSEFVLRGTYQERDFGSGVSLISVNGEIANIGADKSWFIPVTLNNGDNDFVINIEDKAGNFAELTTRVVLDLLAPVISITSTDISNSEEFTLQGEYIDGQSGVKQISVNGEIADFTDAKHWAMDVVLSAGKNLFNIQIEDEVGNVTAFDTQVVLDTISPEISLTSALLTNQEEYILQGSYVESGSGIDRILVNDVDVSISESNVWSKSINLLPGLNEFHIVAFDRAGNQSEISQQVVMDNLPPGIGFKAPATVKYSNDDGSYYSALLALENEVPLYIRSNQISLAGMLASKENLNNAGIPYFNFQISDQPLNDLETTVEELKIEYRYLINDQLIVNWQSKAIDNNESDLIMPLVTEVLSDAWFSVSQDDVHKIEIRVADLAGNITKEQVSFKAQFYVPELSVSVNDGLSTFSSASFDTRGEIFNQVVTGVSYSLSNPTKRPVRIHLNESSVHSVSQLYDKVVRVNKKLRSSQDLWRRANITGLNPVDADICPQRDESFWVDVGELWNYNGSGWQKLTPAISAQEVVDVFSDNPKITTDWVDLSIVDSSSIVKSNQVAGGSVFYNYDYLVNYDPSYINPVASVATHISSWTKKDSDGNVIAGEPCSDVIAIQKQTSYTYADYVDENGPYPRNSLTSGLVIQPFFTRDFSVFLEDGSELVSNNNWYEIPAEANVTIIKYVETPNLTLRDDSQVLNSESIFDYDAHELDKQFIWDVSHDLLLKTQFNPDNHLSDEANVREQSLQFERKQFEFVRN